SRAPRRKREQALLHSPSGSRRQGPLDRRIDECPEREFPFNQVSSSVLCGRRKGALRITAQKRCEGRSAARFGHIDRGIRRHLRCGDLDLAVLLSPSARERLRWTSIASVSVAATSAKNSAAPASAAAAPRPRQDFRSSASTSSLDCCVATESTKHWRSRTARRSCLPGAVFWTPRGRVPGQTPNHSYEWNVGLLGGATLSPRVACLRHWPARRFPEVTVPPPLHSLSLRRWELPWRRS